MFTASFSLVATFSLLLGTEVAPRIPLENAYLELQFDHVKRAQLGLTLTDISMALKRFIKDKDSYKLSDLKNVSVTRQTTGKTHKVKELGEIDVRFTRIRPRKEESDMVTLCPQLDADKCAQLGLTPTEVADAVKRFVKDKDIYKLSDLKNVSVTSQTTGKTHKVKELGEIDVQFTRKRAGKEDVPRRQLNGTGCSVECCLYQNLVR